MRPIEPPQVRRHDSMDEQKTQPIAVPASPAQTGQQTTADTQPLPQHSQQSQYTPAISIPTVRRAAISKRAISARIIFSPTPAERPCTGSRKTQALVDHHSRYRGYNHCRQLGWRLRLPQQARAGAVRLPQRSQRIHPGTQGTARHRRNPRHKSNSCCATCLA